MPKFIRISKLNAIRRELLDTPPSETSVSAVALKYHINHLGRFSANYRELFHQYPSETLIQNRTAP